MSKRIIMLLTNEFNPDPRVYKEAIYLVGQGHSVTILCWDREPSRGLPERENMDGIEVIRYLIPSVLGSGKKQLGAFFAYIRACRAYLKENPCDFIHCHDIDGAITGYLAGRRGIPRVFDMHELYEDMGGHSPWKRWVWRELTMFFIRRSVYALYVIDIYRQDAYRSVQDKLLVLKNYPNADIVRPLPKTQSDVFRIGYHGAVRGQVSQFTTLFEAVKNMEDVRVDIHGGGPDLPELRNVAQRYRNVYIHGPFNGVTELSGLYADADIVYAGYRRETLTREYTEVVKFHECILTGTPMIVTDCFTNMANQINEYGYGLTCDTLDVDAVRQAILKLKDDTAFRKQCAENERARAHLYDWKQAVRVLDRIYQK